MCDYGGAEICELIGLYLADQLGSKYDNDDIGLYSDDGLAIIRNTNSTHPERIKQFPRISKW